MSGDEIPNSPWPTSTRAPGKCILFGEHAVVHGKPELLLAIDLYTQVGIREGRVLRLNGDTEALRRNPYLRVGLERFGREGQPLELKVTSRIPKASGLGSSAAFSAALAANLAAADGGCTRAQLAQHSFSIEREAQGVGSPGDTTAAVGGGYLSLNGGPGETLWEVTDGSQQWTVRRIADPGWVWLVAYSGIPRNTADTVRKVAERLAQPDGPEVLEEFESVARDGIRAIVQEDRRLVGELLDANQELLRKVGVSHPRLEALLEAAHPVSEGTKLTGAGAGGSIVALTKSGRELEAARLVARAGGVPYIVRASAQGAEVVPAPAS